MSGKEEDFNPQEMFMKLIAAAEKSTEADNALKQEQLAQIQKQLTQGPAETRYHFDLYLTKKQVFKVLNVLEPEDG